MSKKYMSYKNAIRVTLGLLAIACFALLSCDRDCLTCPCDKPPASNGYNFYIYQYSGIQDDSHPWIWVWNSGEHKLTDSIFVDSGFAFTEVDVTADESHLLISSGGSGGYPVRTRILDLSTRQIIRELPYGGEIEVSPNGQYIVIQANPLHIIDAVTFDDILTDTLSVGGGAFDSSGNTFFAVRGANLIHRYDIPNRIRLPDITWQGFGLLRRLMPNANGSKLFTHAQLSNQQGVVAVYDVATDLENWMTFTGGTFWTYLERTPDCKKILFTDPEDPFDALSTRAVHFIDVAKEQVVLSVPYPYAGPDSPDSMFILTCTEIAISPDGETAAFASFGPPWQGTLSITSHSFNDFWQIDALNDGFGISIACRKNT